MTICYWNRNGDSSIPTYKFMGWCVYALFGNVSILVLYDHHQLHPYCHLACMLLGDNSLHQFTNHHHELSTCPTNKLSSYLLAYADSKSSALLNHPMPVLPSFKSMTQSQLSSMHSMCRHLILTTVSFLFIYTYSYSSAGDRQHNTTPRMQSMHVPINQTWTCSAAQAQPIKLAKTQNAIASMLYAINNYGTTPC